MTKIRALTPDALADLCRQVPDCRVELDGTTYKVYPPDPEHSPVFFSSVRIRNGTGLDNKISDLRKRGVDIRALLAPPTPTPTPTPKDIPPMTAARVPDISPTITRKEAAELRDMVRAASETAVSLLAEAEKEIRALVERVADHRAEIDELRAEVRHLRESGGVPAPKAPRPPTRAQIIREAVLVFYAEHPRMKITPSMVEANIGDDLPQDRQPGDVSTACKELVKAGKLNGGATRDTPQARKGLYWFEPPAGAGENGEQQQ